MGNGQLKPAFNLQHGVGSGYITWLTAGPQPTDTATLIPFLKEAKEYLKFKYIKIAADAGYESEENYLFLEEDGQAAFIKPSNYETSKRRNYKNDIGRMENMDYDAEKDLYIAGIPNRKQDMQFRRYLSRGAQNVLAGSVLLAMAKNLNKLHNKIQKGKTGTHLFALKAA